MFFSVNFKPDGTHTTNPSNDLEIVGDFEVIEILA